MWSLCLSVCPPSALVSVPEPLNTFFCKFYTGDMKDVDTRENRNPLKPQAKFDNVHIACNQNSNFLGLCIRKYEIKYTYEVTKLKIEQVCFILIFKVVSDPACCMKHLFC